MKYQYLCLLAFCTIFSGVAQTFDYKNSGTDIILYDISIPPGSNDTAYATGSQFTVQSPSVIIKTTDAGETWNTIYPTSGSIEGLENIIFVTDQKGFAIGYEHFLLTEDAGVTWTQQSVGSDIWRYVDIDFHNEMIGFVSAFTNSSGFVTYYTDDGGATWTEGTNTSQMGTIAFDFADETTLFSVGFDQIISKSTDSGASWNIIRSGIPGFVNLRVFFKDADNGVASGEDGELLVTDDGGDNWMVFSTGYHNFYALTYRNDELIAGGTDQDVYYSSDNGENWTLVHDGPNDAVFYDIEFFADGSALICGSQGTILKVTDLVLDSSEVSLTSLTHYFDSNDQQLHIKTASPILALSLYSIDGKRLIQKTGAGSKEGVLNMATYSTAIYIIEVQTDRAIKRFKFIKY